MRACVSYEWTCLHPEGPAAQRRAVAASVPETGMSRCGSWGLWCGLNCCAYLMGKPEDVCFGGDSRKSQLCHISLKLRLHRTLPAALVPSSGLLDCSQGTPGSSRWHSRERDWLGSIILKTWLPLSANWPGNVVLWSVFVPWGVGKSCQEWQSGFCPYDWGVGGGV